MPNVQYDPVVSEVIEAAIRVHRVLGPGLLESPYQACLAHALIRKGLRVERQVPVPVVFEDIRLDCGYRLDLVVERDVIIEVKSVDKLVPIHTAQVLTYLRLTGARRALLLNFNGLTLKEGIRSFLGGKQVPGSSKGQ
jgi:GxxExxY protein